MRQPSQPEPVPPQPRQPHPLTLQPPQLRPQPPPGLQRPLLLQHPPGLQRPFLLQHPPGLQRPLLLQHPPGPDPGPQVATPHSALEPLMPIVQTPIPSYSVGKQGCIRIPGSGVFALHDAKQYCSGSGVAPQTSLPLCSLGHQRCTCIPWRGVFALHNAKINILQPAKVILDIYDGDVGTAHCQKVLFGCWVGAPSAHNTVFFLA